jgi:hypothetical protein
MRPAGDLENPAAGPRVDSVIAAEGVGLQLSRIICQELRRAVPLAIFREVVPGMFGETNAILARVREA